MINLEKIVNKINLMPNSKDKAVSISLLNSYINFLYDSKQITRDEAKEIIQSINESELFLKHYISTEKIQINNLFMATNRLNNMYKTILNYANNYQTFSIDIPDTDIKKLFKYANDFLKYIDMDIYKLLDKLINDNLIYESDINDHGGKCYKLDGYTSAIVIKFNTIPFYKVFTLIHEMGHAYSHYITRGNSNLIRSNLGNECIPRIFEHLFIDYLKDNYLLDKNTIEIYERFFLIHQLSLTNSVYIINKLLLDGKINTNFHIENIKTKLDFNDYYNLSILKPKNDENQMFLSFNNNYYAYAYLLSMVVKDMFKHDEKKAKEFIKQFPVYARELTTNELINLFSKTDYINATNRYTSKVLAKTHYK